MKTSLTLIASKTTPQANEPIEFMAKLRWWDPPTSTWKPLSGKSVTLWCYNYWTGALESSVTKTTEPYGQVIWDKSWSSTGSYNCFASFAGTSSYAASKSTAVNVNVHQIGTSLTFTVTKTKSNVGQPVSFTWTLRQWSVVQNKWVPLPHYQIKVYHDTAWAGGGVDRYQDGIFTTDAYGVAKAMWTFTSPATRTYTATSAASNVYPRQITTMAVVTKYATKLSLYVYHPTIGQHRVYGYLLDQNGNGINGKRIDIYYRDSSTGWKDKFFDWRTTYRGGSISSDGYYQLTEWASHAKYYHATFAYGTDDAAYWDSVSNEEYIT